MSRLFIFYVLKKTVFQ